MDCFFDVLPKMRILKFNKPKQCYKQWNPSHRTEYKWVTFSKWEQTLVIWIFYQFSCCCFSLFFFGSLFFHLVYYDLTHSHWSIPKIRITIWKIDKNNAFFSVISLHLMAVMMISIHQIKQFSLSARSLSVYENLHVYVHVSVCCVAFSVFWSVFYLLSTIWNGLNYIGFRLLSFSPSLFRFVW